LWLPVGIEVREGNALMTIAAWLLLVGSLLGAEHTTDTLDEVRKQLVAEKAVLLDVREPVEWEEGHLKEATSLPLSRLRKGIDAAELKKLLPEGKILYAHCFAGVRCLEAADRLKAAGYELRPLKPGYKDLLKAGFEKAAP
jgi:rhodanese-related sulfurtransferase